MSLQSFVANSLSLSRVFIGYYIFQHTAIDLQSLLFCLLMALITDFSLKLISVKLLINFVERKP